MRTNRLLTNAGLFHDTPQKKETKFYILWNPSHYAPPTARFATKVNARVRAKEMAKANPGSKFYVCECQESFQATTVTNEVLA